MESVKPYHGYGLSIGIFIHVVVEYFYLFTEG